MFDPVTLGAGAVLTGGSVIANLFADADRRRAQEEALRNAFLTDLAFQNRSNQINAQARDRYANFDADMAAKAKELGLLFGSAAQPGATPPGSISVPQIARTGNSILANERAKQMAGAQLFNQQQGDALGSLRSFDQTLGTAGRGVARDAISLGQNLSAQRGALNLLPQQLADAQDAGGIASLFGDLSRGAGNIALSAGINGYGPGNAGSLVGVFPTSFSKPNPSARPLSLASMFS